MTSDPDASHDDGFAPVYGVQLLYETKPRIDRAALHAALKACCGDVDDIGTPGDPSALHFAFPRFPVRFSDGAVPAQTLIASLSAAPTVEALQMALWQSRDWPEARSVVERCRAAVLVSDFLASSLHRADRLRLVQGMVSAVLAVASCLALHWCPSQRLVDPEAYLRTRAGGGDDLFPAINVRLFNVMNGDTGDTVMDTIGLAALGVPDLQCHCRDLDCGRMAAVLLNSADYLFEHGDVIEDGHTIQGLDADQRWRCRHEGAAVHPPRTVLDLDPGEPHAAGERLPRGAT